MPFGVTSYYRALAHVEDPTTDPIAAQFLPRPEENTVLPYETNDPLDDDGFRVSDRAVHHYRDRILILANDRCAVYCRHCFRRHFTGSSTGRITPEELGRVADYLTDHEEVQEIILSGGDPLMMPDADLAEVLGQLTGARPGLTVRIASRVPVVLPSRITPALAELLASHGTTWMVTHANHPAELTGEFRDAIRRLLTAGIPVLNQAVLLRGVNDDIDTLEALMRGLVASRVKPYYLFQGDLAAGTSHFRVNLGRGLELMEALRARVTGLAMPTYAVDLPESGGKIPLDRSTILRREAGWFILRGPGGREYRYPDEDDRA